MRQYNIFGGVDEVDPANDFKPVKTSKMKISAVEYQREKAGEAAFIRVWIKTGEAEPICYRTECARSGAPRTIADEISRAIGEAALMALRMREAK